MYWKSSKYIFLNVCILFGVTSKFPYNSQLWSLRNSWLSLQKLKSSFTSHHNQIHAIYVSVPVGFTDLRQQKIQWHHLWKKSASWRLMTQIWQVKFLVDQHRIGQRRLHILSFVVSSSHLNVQFSPCWVKISEAEVSRVTSPTPGVDNKLYCCYVQFHKRTCMMVKIWGRAWKYEMCNKKIKWIVAYKRTQRNGTWNVGWFNKH